MDGLITMGGMRNANIADHIAGLLRGTTQWKTTTKNEPADTLRPWSQARIEVASGNPEDVDRLANILNYGALLGERVRGIHIVDSVDENFIVTIFPHEMMSQV